MGLKYLVHLLNQLVLAYNNFPFVFVDKTKTLIGVNNIKYTSKLNVQIRYYSTALESGRSCIALDIRRWNSFRVAPIMLWKVKQEFLPCRRTIELWKVKQEF